MTFVLKKIKLFSLICCHYILVSNSSNNQFSPFAMITLQTKNRPLVALFWNNTTGSENVKVAFKTHKIFHYVILYLELGNSEQIGNSEQLCEDQKVPYYQVRLYHYF